MGKRQFNNMVSITLTLFLLSACSSGESAYESLDFPDEPPKEVLYDTSIIELESEWGPMNTHDPSIFKDGEWYYTFSTDIKVGGTPSAGIQVRKSKDLITWEYIGTALSSIPEDAFDWTGATNLWAPDVTKIGNTYYLYYSVSTFGSNQSWIGLATSSDIEGPWKDQGEVIKSETSDEYNAIDPAITYDKEGNLWMSYGSFFGGIYIKQLNAETGKPIDSKAGKLIAKRSPEAGSAIEGPYITYNEKEDKYYLFVSYDSLYEDYNVRVSRSDEIDGEYVDYNNNSMTDIDLFAYEVGTKLLGGYKFEGSEGWIAPGHNSILNDDGNYYIIHHARGEEDTNWPYLHIRRILWSDDGWPLISPERYAGEQEQSISKAALEGEWQFISQNMYNNGILASENMTLLSKGEIEGNTKVKSWELSDENTLHLVYEDKKVTGKLIPSWDWENWNKTIVFTGIDDSGTTFWAKKIQ